jgi:hypothetical protein
MIIYEHIEKKLALNVKLFVMKVAKCKQSSILTSYKILIHCNQEAKSAKDGSGNWPMCNLV